MCVTVLYVVHSLGQFECRILRVVLLIGTAL